ncbi:MAG TPA: ThiF family adenylyltransferase, partial [Myxococcota bacterium]|nr:ThiF family adenylyltransferase [Myxococcota bacterium]
MPKRLALDFLEARPVRVPAWSRLHLALIGAGGTGSWLLPHLVRLAHLVQASGKTVTLGISDPDTVAPANVARQNFLLGDVGHAKARVLAARYGLAYGLEIAAWVEPFGYRHLHDTYRSDTLTVLLGAVDNAVARTSIAEYVTRAEGHQELPRCWWVDSGNSYQSGQICLGNTAALPALRGAFATPGYCNRLPLPSLLHPDLLVPRPEEATTARLSCAELTAANAQSLLVNTTAATIAADFV